MSELVWTGNRILRARIDNSNEFIVWMPYRREKYHLAIDNPIARIELCNDINKSILQSKAERINQIIKE